MFARFQPNRRKTKPPRAPRPVLAPHGLLASSILCRISDHGLDFSTIAADNAAVSTLLDSSLLAIHAFRGNQTLESWTFRVHLRNNNRTFVTRLSRRDVEALGISLAPLKPGTYFASLTGSNLRAGDVCEPLPLYEPLDKHCGQKMDLPPPYVAF